jgi:prephenate dehydrogenase
VRIVTAISERLAVVGLGLLGGSVALAAKRRGAAVRVVGATRSDEARRRALADGAVDEIVALEDVARGADLVVLATPIYAMPDVLRRVAPGLGRGAIVTDVGSVKAPLTDTLPGLLPPGALYVGSHPMAGSHERGMHAAREDLLEGAPCIVTEMGEPAAVARVCAFWSALGSRVVRRDAREHDAEVAWMSHLPHVLAFAYARTLRGAPAGAPELAGSGFRDFTRIAHSDPELWGDILTTNRKALSAPLEAAAEALAELARLLEAGDAEALERWLVEARSTLSLASRDSQRRTKTDI